MADVACVYSCVIKEIVELHEQYIGYDIETSTDRFDVDGIVKS